MSVIQINRDCLVCLFVYLGIDLSPQVCPPYLKRNILKIYVKPFWSLFVSVLSVYLCVYLLLILILRFSGLFLFFSILSIIGKPASQFNHDRLSGRIVLQVLACCNPGLEALDWRLSEPGFDPSYGKILSSHTDEFWLNETDLSVDDYIYIYIYGCVTGIQKHRWENIYTNR